MNGIISFSALAFPVATVAAVGAVIGISEGTGIGSLTLAEIWNYAIYGAYGLGAVLSFFLLRKVYRGGRGLVQLIEKVPGRFFGSVLSFLALTGGPYASLNLFPENAGAGIGAAGGSIFLLLSGLHLLFNSKRLADDKDTTDDQQRGVAVAALRSAQTSLRTLYVATEGSTREVVNVAGKDVQRALAIIEGRSGNV
jgi:hypothetical protein